MPKPTKQLNKKGYQVVLLSSPEDHEDDNSSIPLSHYRRWINRNGEPVNVPVVDVRDGLAERMLADSMIRQSNRSRYISYNQYHISPKKPKTL